MDYITLNKIYQSLISFIENLSKDNFRVVFSNNEEGIFEKYPIIMQKVIKEYDTNNNISSYNYITLMMPKIEKYCYNENHTQCRCCNICIYPTASVYVDDVELNKLENLFNSADEVKVPVYFIAGRIDYEKLSRKSKMNLIKIHSFISQAMKYISKSEKDDINEISEIYKAHFEEQRFEYPYFSTFYKVTSPIFNNVFHGVRKYNEIDIDIFIKQIKDFIIRNLTLCFEKMLSGNKFMIKTATLRPYSTLTGEVIR